MPVRKKTKKTPLKPAASTKKKPAQAKKAVPKKPSVKAKATKPVKPPAKKVSRSTKSVLKQTVPKKKKAEIKKKTEGAGENKDRLLEIRKALIEKKAAIVREAKNEIAKYMSGENRQLVDTALDEGDWAVVDISEDINLMRLGAHRKAMHDIDEVMRKIKEGTYGICEECGEEISEKRLHVIPTATLCITCQGNKEQLDAIVGREEA